jgi:hypothetical protein
MSLITHSDNASQSVLAGGQVAFGDETAQEVGAEPPQATAATAKGQARRAKSAPLEIARANNPPKDTGVTSSMPTSTTHPKRTSKQDIVLGMLRQVDGATIDELMEATAWQAHSMRGFLSGTVRKKLKLHLISDVVGNGVRRYRVVSGDQASGSDEAGHQPATDGSASVQGA